MGIGCPVTRLLSSKWKGNSELTFAVLRFQVIVVGGHRSYFFERSQDIGTEVSRGILLHLYTSLLAL